jgi:hypothetical protein
VVRRATLLASRDHVPGQPCQEYDVTRDGQRFVMVRNLGGRSHLTVTLHALRGLDDHDGDAARR